MMNGSINVVAGRATPSYIIDGEALTVIDVCFPSDAKNIIDYVRNRMHRPIDDIKLVVLTHSHIDHVNGADYLIKKTGSKLAAHAGAERYLRGKKAIKLAGIGQLFRFISFMIKNGLPRPSLRDTFTMPWAGIPGIRKGIGSRVDYRLKDGDTLPGCPGWLVYHTPGHTDDSICLYNSEMKALISGDFLVNLKDRLCLAPLLRLDEAATRKSFQKLKRLEVSRVYPGWGRPVRGEALLDKVIGG